MPLADRLPAIPFPSDVKTAPLRIVDYPSLVADDPAACAALLASATELGFFYLRDTGLDYEPLKDACAAVFDLAEAEKRAFDVGKLGTSFGFKAVGTDNVDEAGTVDTNEQFNIGADDILAGLSEEAGLHGHGYPRPIVDAADALGRFTRHATAVCFTLLARFERALGLPDGTLKRLHEQGGANRSPTKARVIRNPPQDDGARLALGSHTDFGSIVRSPCSWLKKIFVVASPTSG
jgi:isopenicillin N synthase-like dioxygenase